MEKVDVDKIIIKIDAKLVVDAVNGSPSYNTVIGDIVQACRSRLRSLPSWRLKCINRDAKVVAYSFARIARSPYWIECPIFMDNFSDTSYLCNCINFLKILGLKKIGASKSLQEHRMRRLYYEQIIPYNG